MRKTLWIILTVLLGACAGVARADDVTLDVSGSLTLAGSGGSCSVSGCTLGGTLVIDNTAGTVVSADVTMGGESPTVGPFTDVLGVALDSTLDVTSLVLEDASGDSLNLEFATPTEGSLVSYDGGPLTPWSFSLKDGTIVTVEVDGGGHYGLTSGSLTAEVTPTPEPSTVGLMLIGVGLVGLGMRKRIARGLSRAI